MKASARTKRTSPHNDLYGAYPPAHMASFHPNNDELRSCTLLVAYEGTGVMA